MSDMNETNESAVTDIGAPELVGHIGVDAGLCWVGDPGSILHSDPKPKAIGKSWDEFCERMDSMTKVFNYDHGNPGLGICVCTYDDGVYPVFVERNEEGRIVRLTVEFL